MEDKQKKKQQKYETQGINFKDGKPTKESMEKVFEKDKELFLDLQNDYFTTKGRMGEGKLDVKAMMKKFKNAITGEK